MIRAVDVVPRGSIRSASHFDGEMRCLQCPMPPSESRLAVGQLVRFIAPLNEDEREEKFTVLELRGERVLVEFVCGMSIWPTFVYLAGDLVPVDG